MTEDVTRAIARALDDARPSRLGVAVSGGGDSMALLDAALRVAACPVEAVTVNHGLRPEAAEEAAYVAAFCREREVPHKTMGWHWDGTGNLQAAAREGRMAQIADWAGARRIDSVALGHTQDDVAETFLMRLARGSGLDGLSAMSARRERRGLTWLRPLLGIGRETCRAYLVARDVAWRDDPSNDDPGFDRVRARKALADLGIDTARIADTAIRLRAARGALDGALRRLIREEVTEDRGDLLLPRLDPGDELHRRMLGAALRWVGGSAYMPRATSLERLFAADAPLTLAGCLISPAADGIRVAREPRSVAQRTCATTEMWDGRWRLDGPHASCLRIGALGEDVGLCTDWRDLGLPRASLAASPAVRDGSTLVAAPLAGLTNGWRALADGRGNFAEFPGND